LDYSLEENCSKRMSTCRFGDTFRGGWTGSEGAPKRRIEPGKTGLKESPDRRILPESER